MRSAQRAPDRPRAVTRLQPSLEFHSLFQRQFVVRSHRNDPCQIRHGGVRGIRVGLSLNSTLIPVHRFAARFHKLLQALEILSLPSKIFNWTFVLWTYTAAVIPKINIALTKLGQPML